MQSCILLDFISLSIYMSTLPHHTTLSGSKRTPNLFLNNLSIQNLILEFLNTFGNYIFIF